VAEGEWEPGFAEVASTLDAVVTARGEGGAGVCVYHRGRAVVDAWAGSSDATGTPWASDTLSMSFSTTKGVTSTLLHLCVERGLLDYDDDVAKHWPELSGGGKDGITVRQLLCHEAGLYDVTQIASGARDLLDWDRMVRGLEGMTPAYEPGSANAYHALTFGWLVGEIIQRVTGVAFRDWLATELAEPLELDGCFIGTPTAEFGRVARIIRPEVDDIARDPGGLVKFASQLGFEIHPEIIARALPRFAVELPTEEALEVPIPAGNGAFTPRSLARMYALLAAGGELDGVRLLSPEVIARATEVQNIRPDLVLAIPVAWRLGYHGVVTSAGILDGAFGHNGLGGSGAFADPKRELAVAFTLNAMGSLLAGDTRFADVAGAAVRAVDQLS